MVEVASPCVTSAQGGRQIDAPHSRQWRAWGGFPQRLPVPVVMGGAKRIVLARPGVAHLVALAKRRQGVEFRLFDVAVAFAGSVDHRVSAMASIDVAMNSAATCGTIALP
jgi:hypothetical protein